MHVITWHYARLIQGNSNARKPFHEIIKKRERSTVSWERSEVSNWTSILRYNTCKFHKTFYKAASSFDHGILIYFHCCFLLSATDDLDDTDLLSLLLEEEPPAPDTANTFGKFTLVVNVTWPVCPPLNRESRYSKKTWRRLKNAMLHETIRNDNF